MAAPSPAAERQNPHVTIAQRVVDIAMFFFATPVAIWLLVSFVLPLAFGLARKADDYVAWLRHVQAWDQVQAQWMTPAIGDSEDPLVEEAWTYRIASNTVRGIVPQEREGFFTATVDDKSPVTRMTGALATKANTWLADRFYPVQTAWWTTFLTRGWYALQLLVLVVPAACVAYFWGEFRARQSVRDGVQPIGHRFLMWMQVVKYSFASIPLVMALPVHLPTLPCLVLLYAVALIGIMRARAQFIEI